MHAFTSFPAASVPRDELGSILVDYLALGRAQTCRRLLVKCCGSVATLIAILTRALGLLSPFMRWMAVAMFVIPPVWAWLNEIRLEWRLVRRLDGVDATATHQLVETVASVSDENVTKGS